MLLTEHQEQYANRNKKNQGRVTIEELTMIRDTIMLPHMLTLCERAIADVRFSANVFKRYFEKFLQMIIAKISKDLYTLRKELRTRNIKLIDEEMDDGVMYHRYVCRGYEDRFGIARETLRAEISIRLTRYAEEILQGKEAPPA